MTELHCPTEIIIDRTFNAAFLCSYNKILGNQEIHAYILFSYFQS